MKAKELKPGVYWVGAIDWNVRDFHGYETPRGTTYNAYLIVDEQIVLVDTVKKTHSAELLQRISSVVDPSRIDLIVANHVEMDHSGSLPEVLAAAPKARVIASPNGEAGLKKHFHQDWPMKAVRTGESLKIGRRTLQFVQVPFVHWPDSMVTYIPEDRILLPNDAFGQHYASANLFDDQNSFGVVQFEAAKYYANIVMPYGPQVAKALDAIAGLDIDLVGPSHGVVWRSHFKDILADYRKWCAGESRNEAVVVYDTMWGSTEAMAKAVASVFEQRGIPVTMRSLKHTHASDVITDVMTARYVALGCPVLNLSMLPTVAGFLAYVKGLKPVRKRGLVFGSYGWDGRAIQEAEGILKGIGWEFPVPAQSVKWVPNSDDLGKLAASLEPLFG